MRCLCTFALCCLLTGPLAAGDEKPEAWSCEGKVLDAGGKPVAGAEVRAYLRQYGGVQKAALLGRMTTEADGVYRFQIKGADTWVLVLARKDGLSLGWADWYQAKPYRGADVALAERVAIEGAVVDEAGKPVPEAGVWLVIAKGSGQELRGLYGRPGMDWLEARTDAGGRFAFNDVPRGFAAEFVISAPGRACLCTMKKSEGRPQLQFQPGRKDIRITLPAEARIEGTVTDAATGKPVAGVALRARSDAPGSALEGGYTRSADDGTFTFTGLRAAEHKVSLAPVKSNEAAEWVAKDLTVTTEAGKTLSGVAFKVSRGCLLEVVVTDARTGKPIEGAQVSLYRQDDQRWLGGTTGADGVARRRLLPAAYQLREVGKRGEYSSKSLMQQVTLAEGTTVVPVTLDPMGRITGRAVDPEGKPVAGADVKLLPHMGTEVKTDADGRFDLPDARPRWYGNEDVDRYLVIRAADRTLAVAVLLGDVSKPLEVALAAAVTFAGRAVDPDGKPVEGAPVTVYLRGNRWGSSLDNTAVGTGADGRYEIKGIPAGARYTVNVNARGRDDLVAFGPGHTEVEVVEGQGPLRDVEVEQIELRPAPYSISGVVVDEDDKPVAGVHVSARSRSNAERQPNRDARSDDQGRFTLEHLSQGAVGLYAQEDQGSGATRRYAQQSLQIDGDVKDVELVLRARQTRPAAPPVPASLAGKPLPGFDALALKLDAAALKDKPVLLCFWDWEQRPSRHAVQELAAKAGALKGRGVAVVLVRSGSADAEAVDAWLKKVKATFAGGTVGGDDPQQTLFAWGVRGLPWLILADRSHTVRAEGFAVAELDATLEPVLTP